MSYNNVWGDVIAGFQAGQSIADIFQRKADYANMSQIITSDGIDSATKLTKIGEIMAKHDPQTAMQAIGSADIIRQNEKTVARQNRLENLKATLELFETTRQNLVNKGKFSEAQEGLMAIANQFPDVYGDIPRELTEQAYKENDPLAMKWKEFYDKKNQQQVVVGYDSEYSPTTINGKKITDQKALSSLIPLDIYKQELENKAELEKSITTAYISKESKGTESDLNKTFNNIIEGVMKSPEFTILSTEEQLEKVKGLKDIFTSIYGEKKEDTTTKKTPATPQQIFDAYKDNPQKLNTLISETKKPMQNIGFFC